LGGTGGCDPSSIQASAAFGGTGGCDPSSLTPTGAIFGGTGGCDPSNKTSLGGTGGCDPSRLDLNVLWEGKFPGAKLAAKPRITNRKTTALAVGIIAISSFLV
jgi:hypothetical protein